MLRWFLLVVAAAAALFLLVGWRALWDYAVTPEGQQAGGQIASGALDVLSNPLNPFAWAKLIGAGAAFGSGALAGVEGTKAAGRGARAAGGVVKRRLSRAKVAA